MRSPERTKICPFVLFPDVVLNDLAKCAIMCQDSQYVYNLWKCAVGKTWLGLTGLKSFIHFMVY